MTKSIKKLAALFIIAVMSVSFIPILGFQDVYAAEGGTPLSGDVLNGCKVRIRPAGSHQPLSIYHDGSDSHDHVHLFVQGKSSQFYLEKKDDDSYLIYFYTHYRDDKPKTSGDCRLDIDNGGNESGYYKEGQLIRVYTGNDDQMNKRWQFIPQEDGTYYIRNKLSGQYWSLARLDNINANTTELVQRKTPMKWVIEIVDGNNDRLKSVNDYDSRNFTYNGKTVKSTNWMGALPGSLKITDISIPGTHDSGACNLSTNQNTMSTQRYYIDELLNSGVRHLDVRTGLDGNNTVRIVHSTCNARNRSNQDLTLSEVVGWIDDFLEANPTETVIFQIKVDANGDACERETFRQLEALAKATNSRIWAGDHVPALKEVRGKILIISRLTPEKLQGGNFDIVKDGKTLKWALDCHDWKDSYDQVSALTAQGTNYEVWTQDNWNRSFSNKKTYVRATLFGKINGYTNGTMYRYDRAKEVGKDAWVFNYTSANNGSTENPYEISKDMHQWIYDSSDYSKSDRLVCKDTFTGVMAFDYMDGLMATKIYKTNFNRQYITIHGVTADGKEPVDPLTLFVGDESESITKLKSDTTKQIIKAHFNTDPYLLMTAENGEILSASKASDREAFESGVQDFNAAVTKGSVGSDLYVHLEEPIREAEYEVEMPLCKTDVSAADPKVTVFIDDRKPYETVKDASGNQKAFIIENTAPDSAFTGAVEGGETMNLQVYLEPKWGYRFSDYCTVTSDTTDVLDSAVLQNGQLKITAAGYIPHSADRIDEVPASCVSNGVKEHYICDKCKKKFFSMTEMGNQFQVEASDEDICISAPGHEWGEWEVEKEPTVSETGIMSRKCRREGCTQQETAVIPVLTHVHECSHHNAKEAEDCSQTGNIEYWVCDQGDDPCYSYFSDADCKTVITPDETNTTAGAHAYGEPRYTEIRVGNMLLVTAVRECTIDSSHRETEMAYADVDYHAPTCTEDGYKRVSVTFKNNAFNNYESDDVEYPKLEHEWGEEKVILKPTCSTPGICSYYCNRCGESKTEEIAPEPDAHITFTEEDETSNTASCTEGGRQTQYVICSLCEKLIETKRISTEPLGHKWSDVTYEWAEDYSAVTATRVCRRDGCGEEESETVKTTNRIIEEASCETAGMIKYNVRFENEAFDTQEEDVEIPALSHNWGEWKVTKEPTETEAGEKQRVCRNDPEHVETEAIPAKGSVPAPAESHQMVRTKRKAASCTETGNIEYYTCSDCGGIYRDENGTEEISEGDLVLPALGHDWTEWETVKEATETEEGQQERFCRNDPEHKQTREIPVLSHTHKMVKTAKKLPTCEEDGNIMYYKCSECGWVFTDHAGSHEIDPLDTVLPAAGHDWGEWTVTKEPTEKEEGEKQRVCRNDPEHVETEAIPAKGSDPDQTGTDGTAVGSGASAASADKAVTGMTSDKDPKGAVYNKLRFRSTKQTNNTITLKWRKLSGATKYVLYGNKCGSRNKMKKLAAYTGSSKKLTRVAGKKIKKGTYYKFILVALDKDNNVVSTSKVIHIATKGGKVTNPKKVTVKKGTKALTKVTVKKDKTVTVRNVVTKASKKLRLRIHRKVRYESSNRKIATVTSKGKIKGIKKGTCYIYAYAQNGVAKKIKVTVN